MFAMFYIVCFRSFDPYRDLWCRIGLSMKAGLPGRAMFGDVELKWHEFSTSEVVSVGEASSFRYELRMCRLMDLVVIVVEQVL